MIAARVVLVSMIAILTTEVTNRKAARHPARTMTRAMTIFSEIAAAGCCHAASRPYETLQHTT
jgi:hypothetical protein